MTKEYFDGFSGKCAERGVDPASLIKEAQFLSGIGNSIAGGLRSLPGVKQIGQAGAYVGGLIQGGNQEGMQRARAAGNYGSQQVAKGRQQLSAAGRGYTNAVSGTGPGLAAGWLGGLGGPSRGEMESNRQLSQVSRQARRNRQVAVSAQPNQAQPQIQQAAPSVRPWNSTTGTGTRTPEQIQQAARNNRQMSEEARYNSPLYRPSFNEWYARQPR